MTISSAKPLFSTYNIWQLRCAAVRLYCGFSSKQSIFYVPRTNNHEYELTREAKVRRLRYPGVYNFRIVKYNLIYNKWLQEPYGVQDFNHLIPGKGKPCHKLPWKVQLKKDKIYAWCSCGLSHNQPLCDGPHEVSNTKLKPVRYIPKQDEEVWFCGCKQTENRPFCDMSHRKLPKQEEEFGYIAMPEQMDPRDEKIKQKIKEADEIVKAHKQSIITMPRQMGNFSDAVQPCCNPPECRCKLELEITETSLHVETFL